MALKNVLSIVNATKNIAHYDTIGSVDFNNLITISIIIFV